MKGNEVGKGKPGVSVIIPTYNREISIRDCINSVLNQTHSPQEILVIDDGSTDKTPEILSEYGDRIKVIRQQNGGVSAARNAGLSAATGEWIAFLDSDDLWFPNRLEVFYEDVKNFPEGICAHIANIMVEYTTVNRDLFEIRGFDVPEGKALPIFSPLEIALAGVFSQCLIARRALLQQLNGFDTAYSMYEDTNLYSHLALLGPWFLNNTVIGTVRRLEGDDIALTNQEQTQKRYLASSSVSILARLLEESLTSNQCFFVQKSYSGALLSHARVEHELKSGDAKKLLFAAAKAHPSLLRGWGKSLLPLVFGEKGFQLVFRKSKSSFRR